MLWEAASAERNDFIDEIIALFGAVNMAAFNAAYREYQPGYAASFCALYTSALEAEKARILASWKRTRAAFNEPQD